MALQLIARDLYRLWRIVKRLEAEIAASPPAKRAALKHELRRAQSEHDRMRAILDGRLDR